MPSGIHIGDVFMAMLLDTSDFQAAAAKEGAKAGDSAGAAMSEGIKGRLGDLLKGGVFLGVGIELGRLMLKGLETAVTDVINVIPDMIRKGQDFGLTVEDISVKTGASAEAASRFVGTLTYLGLTTDGLGQSLKTLSVQVVNNEANFDKLGIKVRTSANGPLLDTITILDNIRSYMSKTGNATTNLALATTLLGRSAGSLIAYLDLTDAQAAALNATMDALGVTMSEKTISDIEGAKRESNLLGLAWQGLSNVLTAEVGPTIRQVLGAAFQFIVDHGAQVRQTLVDITNAALGLMSGLLGMSGITPFQAQLDGLAGSSDNATLSFEQWAQQNALTIPVIDTAAEATRAASAANTAATKAIDTQTKALADLDKAQETTYQTRLKSIKSLLDERMATLDAAEAARTLAQQQHDLNEQLNQAQIDLAEAQAGKNGKVDATAVSAAMAKVADVQNQQAELAHQTAVNQQKDAIKSVKDYVDAIDQLVSDSTDKTATLADLKKREGALTAGGKPATGSDAALELQAVLDAEARVKQQATNTANQQALDLQASLAAETRAKQKATNTANQDALAARKTELAAEAAAASSADSASVVADKKRLATLQAAYKAYLAEQEKSTKSWLVTTHDAILGDPKAGTGLGGAFSKAFTDGQSAGEAFRKWIDTQLLPSLRSILDVMSKIATALGDQGLTMAGGAAVGAKIGGLPGFVAGAGIGGIIAAKPGTQLTDPGGPLQGLLQLYDSVFGTHYSTTGTRERGGPAPRGVPLIVGEKRPEVFVPSENGSIVESIGALRGMTAGGTTVHTHIDLDGREVADVVSRYQADDYRR